jgi:hypothetical protein
LAWARTGTCRTGQDCAAAAAAHAAQRLRRQHHALTQKQQMPHASLLPTLLQTSAGSSLQHRLLQCCQLQQGLQLLALLLLRRAQTLGPHPQRTCLERVTQQLLWHPLLLVCVLSTLSRSLGCLRMLQSRRHVLRMLCLLQGGRLQANQGSCRRCLQDPLPPKSLQ